MASPAMNLGPGEVLAGRYRIERQLGQGGFGAVYQATDVSVGRPVALKLLLPELAADDAGLARFRREADLVQRLGHPNVVRLYDFGAAADGRPYMAFELLTGKPLARLLEESGRLPVARAVRIGSQVLKALADAHAAGVIHRDIKPSNLFVGDFPGEPDFVKVLDFGIAKVEASGQQTAMTRTGQVLGTPSYMAPEQVLGQPITPATDLYAVGLVLAEMLSGAMVYQGTSMQICVAQASEAPPPIPPEVLASPLGAVIRRATEKRVERRYASAMEMRSHLEAATAATLGSAAPMPLTAAVQVGAPTHAALPMGMHPQLALAGLGRPSGPGGYAPMPPPGLFPAPPRSRSSALPWLLGVAALVLLGAGTLLGVKIAGGARAESDDAVPIPLPPTTPIAPAPTVPASDSAPAPSPTTPRIDPLSPTTPRVPFPGPSPTPAPSPTPTPTVPPTSTRPPVPPPTSTGTTNSNRPCGCAPGDLMCAMKCSANGRQ